MPSSHSDAYLKYIRSEAWARRRQEYFKVLGKRACEVCDTTKYIHVHHRTYERMGHELDSDLNALCQTCHDRVHVLHRSSNGKLTIAEATDKVLDGYTPRVKVKNPRKKKRDKRDTSDFYSTGPKRERAPRREPMPVGRQRNSLELLDEQIRERMREETKAVGLLTKQQKREAIVRSRKAEALRVAHNLMLRANGNVRNLTPDELKQLKRARKTLQK